MPAVVDFGGGFLVLGVGRELADGPCVRAREGGGAVSGTRQCRENRGGHVSDAQRLGRIDDVLTRDAPVHVPGGLRMRVRHASRQRREKRQQQVARARGVPMQRPDVELLRPCRGADGPDARRGDEAEFGLRLCERHFGVEQALQVLRASGCPLNASTVEAALEGDQSEVLALLRANGL